MLCFFVCVAPPFSIFAKSANIQISGFRDIRDSSKRTYTDHFIVNGRTRRWKVRDEFVATAFQD